MKIEVGSLNFRLLSIFALFARINDTFVLVNLIFTG